MIELFDLGNRRYLRYGWSHIIIHASTGWSISELARRKNNHEYRDRAKRDYNAMNKYCFRILAQ
jgi:hypothetical protein